MGRRPVVWLLLPSILFGAAHLPNGETLTDGALWAVWAGFLGLACADLTARTGSIGAAVGLHLANNLFAMVVIAEPGMPGSGVALWLFEEPLTDLADMTDEGLGLVAIAADVGLSALGVGLMWGAALLGLRATRRPAGEVPHD